MLVIGLLMVGAPRLKQLRYLPHDPLDVNQFIQGHPGASPA
jgi:hypothetical protein